jgi:hypothetical protein
MDPLCKDHPELCIGGALDSSFYSKKGAFNGSGVALAGESWNAGQRRLFTLYFQHHSGDIRYMQYRTDKQWDGGNKAQTVATDAKNGTAISAVAYALNGTQYVSNTMGGIRSLSTGTDLPCVMCSSTFSISPKTTPSSK